MEIKRDSSQWKNSLGGLLFNFYLFMFCGTLVAFLAMCYFNREIDLDLILILVESLFFLIAGLCTIFKLKSKSQFIWFGIFDFALFPLAIPFYIHVYKSFHHPTKVATVQLFQAIRWSLIQSIVDLVVFLLGIPGWFAMLIITWQEPYRNLVLGFVLFGLLATSFGATAAFLNYRTLKLYGKLNPVFLWSSLILFGFGWPFAISWLVFKPKIMVNSFDIVERNVLDLQKRFEKQPN